MQSRFHHWSGMIIETQGLARGGGTEAWERKEASDSSFEYCPHSRAVRDGYTYCLLLDPVNSACCMLKAEVVEIVWERGLFLVAEAHALSKARKDFHSVYRSYPVLGERDKRKGVRCVIKGCDQGLLFVDSTLCREQAGTR